MDIGFVDLVGAVPSAASARPNGAASPLGVPHHFEARRGTPRRYKDRGAMPP